MMRDWIIIVLLAISIFATGGCGGGVAVDWDTDAWEYTRSTDTNLRETEWSISWSIGEVEPAITSITCDPDCNIAVTDTWHQESMGFAHRGPDGWYAGKSSNVTSLRKFDMGGNVYWSRTWAGQSNRDNWFEFSDVDADSDGNLYVAGYMSGTVDFDPGEGVEEVTSNGGNDAFVCKFDPDGNFVWVRTWGGENHDGATGVAVNGYGAVAVGGHYYGTVDFDPGDGVEEHESSEEAFGYFMSRFDSDGNFLWVHTWEGGGLSGDRDFFRVLVEMNWEGNVACVSPNDGAVNPTLWISARGTEGRGIRTMEYREQTNIMRLDPTGEVEFEWLWDVTCTGIKIDGENRVFACGWFAGVADMDPSPQRNEQFSEGVSAGAERDPVLCRFGETGRVEWFDRWGSVEDDYPFGLAMGSNGWLYVSGTFGGIADFDPGGAQFVYELKTCVGEEIPFNTFVSSFSPEGEWTRGRTWPRMDEDGRVEVSDTGWVISTSGSTGMLTKSGM